MACNRLSVPRRPGARSARPVLDPETVDPPRHRPIGKAPARCRPVLEVLDDRTLPAVSFYPAVS
jgi:hypothetical protein